MTYYELVGVNLFRMRVLYVGGEALLVPAGFNEDFINKIKAGILSVMLGIKADYALKAYVMAMQVPEESQETKLSPLEQICQPVLNEVARLGELLNSFTISERRDKFASGAAGLAFLRLSSSYDACVLLLRKGYYFEACSVMRLILEQLGFCYALISHGEKEEANWSPRYSINKLKNLVEIAGRLYGELSEKAHLETTQIDKYIPYLGKKQTASILASEELALACSLDLIIITQIHRLVFDAVFYNYPACPAEKSYQEK